MAKPFGTHRAAGYHTDICRNWKWHGSGSQRRVEGGVGNRSWRKLIKFEGLSGIWKAEINDGSRVLDFEFRIVARVDDSSDAFERPLLIHCPREMNLQG